MNQNDKNSDINYKTQERNYKVQDNNREVPILCRREVFEEVFDGLENILAKMISEVTEIGYGELKNQIVLRRNKDLDVKFVKERRSYFLTLDDNGVLHLKVNKNSDVGWLFKDRDVMFIHLDCVEKEFPKSGVPLIKIFFKRDNNIANCFGRLSIVFLDTFWCEKIYQEGSDDNLPDFIKWGTLFQCNDVAKISKILKELLTDKGYSLFMKRLEMIMQDDFSAV